MDFQEDEQTASKEISSIVEITEAFQEVQAYVDNVGVDVASDSVWRDKRIMFDICNKNNKKRKRHKLMGASEKPADTFY